MDCNSYNIAIIVLYNNGLYCLTIACYIAIINGQKPLLSRSIEKAELEFIDKK